MAHMGDKIKKADWRALAEVARLGGQQINTFVECKPQVSDKSWPMWADFVVH